MITLIAAIGRNNELGYHNSMPWHIKEDFSHFKSYTIGKVLIMGRKTFESIGSKCLPGRKTIVVSKNEVEGAHITATSINDALLLKGAYPELVVCGGSTIYEQTINQADKLVITHIDSAFIADTFFPKIDLTRWKIVSSIDASNRDYNYKFVEYTQIYKEQYVGRQVEL